MWGRFFFCSGDASLIVRWRVPSQKQLFATAGAASSGRALLAGALVAAGTAAFTGARCRQGVRRPCLLLEESKPATAKKPAQGSINVEQEMLKRRTVFLTGEVNDDSAKVLVQQLLWFQAEDPNAPVTIYINSGGGLVHSGLAIVDTMLHVSMPLNTVAYGRCFSIAAVVLAAGTPGHRSAFSNARMMIHEPSCSYPKLQVSDMAIKVEELRHTGSTLNRILSERLRRSQAEISDLFKRDRYMAAPEARELGVIDYIRPIGRVEAPSRSCAQSSSSGSSADQQVEQADSTARSSPASKDLARSHPAESAHGAETSGGPSTVLPQLTQLHISSESCLELNVGEGSKI